MRRHGPDLGSPNPTIDPEAMQHLCRQSWPGNFREMENIVRKALLLARGYPIRLDDVNRALSQTVVNLPGNEQSLTAYVDDLLHSAQRGELQNVQSILNEAMERELYGRLSGWPKVIKPKPLSGWAYPANHARKLTQHGLHPTRDGKTHQSEG
jgi:DNA-binding NtrC family response regulator